jgi:hypothetical protein
MSSEGFAPMNQPVPAAPRVQEQAPVAADEPTYDAVPIPGAYAGQVLRSPPPIQTTFGQAR